MQTNSSGYFSQVRDTFTGLAADYLRSRFIDVESADDDRNLADRVDTADGSLVNRGGMSWGLILGLGAAVILGVIVAKKVL